jgi:hypothetical protein
MIQLTARAADAVAVVTSLAIQSWYPSKISLQRLLPGDGTWELTWVSQIISMDLRDPSDMGLFNKSEWSPLKRSLVHTMPLERSLLPMCHRLRYHQPYLLRRSCQH